jgi:phage gp36-like protein
MPQAEYCVAEDLGIFGVNAEALEALPIRDNEQGPIAAASARIDSYLRQQYVLPLTRVGQDVREACAIIAAYRVLSVRGLKPGENPEDQSIRIAYEDTIRWLEKIAAGSVSPDVDDSDTSTPAAGEQAGAARVSSNSQRGWFNENASSALPFQGSRSQR